MLLCPRFAGLYPSVSEKKLEGHLPDAGITRSRNQAKSPAVDVPVRRHELSMVEDVEELATKLQSGSLIQFEVL